MISDSILKIMTSPTSEIAAILSQSESARTRMTRKYIESPSEHTYHKPHISYHRSGRAIDYSMKPEFEDRLQSILAGESYQEWEARKVTPIGSKKILAIGGPRNMEMLPYLGMQEYVVPILKPVTYVTSDELEATRMAPSMETFRYYAQVIGREQDRKMVYVGEDLMSVGRAEELLKEALLEMWVGQPYKD